MNDTCPNAVNYVSVNNNTHFKWNSIKFLVSSLLDSRNFDWEFGIEKESGVVLRVAAVSWK